jgi:hypothetical protein
VISLAMNEMEETTFFAYYCNRMTIHALFKIASKQKNMSAHSHYKFKSKEDQNSEERQSQIFF